MHFLPLIPAKAGIHKRLEERRLAWQKLGPRLRGDERTIAIAAPFRLANLSMGVP